MKFNFPLTRDDIIELFMRQKDELEYIYYQLNNKSILSRSHGLCMLEKFYNNLKVE